MARIHLRKESTSADEAPLFDQYASSYTDEVDHAVAFSGRDAGFFAQAKVDLLCDVIKARLGNAAGRELLDVGCGAGVMHAKLADIGVAVTGADVAARSIEVARALNPFARYEVLHDVALPFSDESFDIAIAVCVLHHVPAGRQVRLIREMSRVTRRGGLVAVIEHNPVNPLTRYAVCRCPFDEDAVLLSPGRTRALLKASTGKPTTRHFLFFPFRRPWVLPVERRLAWLGIGAQYCTYALKEHLGMSEPRPRDAGAQP